MECSAYRRMGNVVLYLFVMAALSHASSIHKTYVGVKGNVAPMYSIFHRGDKINIRCYAAGDSTVPNIYFTWTTGFADPVRLRTGNPPGIAITTMRMDMPNTAMSEMTLDRTFYTQMNMGENHFHCIVISRDGEDPVKFTIEKSL